MCHLRETKLSFNIKQKHDATANLFISLLTLYTATSLFKVLQILHVSLYQSPTTLE